MFGRRRLIWSRVLAAGSLVVLAGCDLGPDYRRPDLELPAAFRASPETQAAAWPADGWWQRFKSPELNALVADARAQNFDIAAAIARVQQADAQVRIAGAGLLPSLNATASGSWQRVSFGTSSRSRSVSGFSTVNSGAGVADLHSYSANLNAAYLVDFWGKVRAGTEAAAANAVFSRFDQQTVALTVIANVATTWFSALAFADRLAVAQRNLADAENILAVIRGRFAAGTASALDIAQQEALVAGERATVPNLRNQMEQQLIGLGILTGRPPEAIRVRPGTLTAIAFPKVAPGLPSQLLERR
ncbi:MAG: TolC family protein, partial [Acetobacteraceae bacterium]|nr:TolC family protein [Acetobacteraceae bacterium]